MTIVSPPPAGATLAPDVVIVGGGLVGGTLACALADSGLSTVVVEAGTLATMLDDRFDGRASAISLTSRRLLDAIGLWPGMAADATPMRHIRVTEGASPLYLHYDHRDVGDEPFGHMVENRHYRRALYARIRELEAVTFLAPARAASVERTDAGVEVLLEGGGLVRARLAVGAEGRTSRLREEAGIRVSGWSYRQVGIVCTVEHERPHGFVAHERFLPAGPFAILPLTGNRSSIVWTERAERAPAIMALDDAGFINEVALRFGDFLGTLTIVGPRWSYPLSLQFAEKAVAPRLALVGDAIHAMHPIAGQGLNMGLRDVAALSEVLAEARRLGLDLGAADVLARYQRWRRFDNTLMLALTDGLNRLFEIDATPVRLARDLGLAAVNAMPPVKRFFMRHAMGMVGELPRLMRGT
ncbi:MAG: UbiH/UbiF/VisC/COQ6 family ubiquinone biosynthesis hydroxylase [Rhodospirillales bacterium]|nr:UbiH/UbiF/VisC/COQ6 family ubiquinone biosynthesis hydroxylase [Rhodospirillales bacterium]